MCLGAILVISGTYWFKTFNKTFSRRLYLLFGVGCMSAGGHFGKWPSRPPGGSSAVALPQICSSYIDVPLCQNWCF